MDVNLPFRLKEMYDNRNFNTDSYRNLDKNYKLVFKNANNNCDNDLNLYEFKMNPFLNSLNKKSFSKMNDYYNYKNIKSLSIDGTEINNNLPKQNNKKSLFEDEYFIDRLKKKNFPISLNNKKKDIKPKKNSFSNSIYFGAKINNNNFIKKNENQNINRENEKTSKLNLPKVKIYNSSPNRIRNLILDEKSSFVNINFCFDSYKKQINKEQIYNFFNKQKKIFNNTPFKNIRNPKIIKYKNSPYDDNTECLKKMIKIEPMVADSNGKLCDLITLKKTKSDLINSFEEENKKVNKNKKQDIILPNLKQISSENNNILRKTFNSNLNSSKICNTESNVSTINQCRHINMKYKRNKDIQDSVGFSSYPKSLTQISSPKNEKDKNTYKKNKIELHFKINPLMYEIPPPNFYSKNFFYYNIYPKNCGWLIKKCFSHRKKWKECHSNFTNLYDFKWKDVVSLKDFIDFSIGKKQMINHYEFHSCLSNKYKMFYNFAKYCEIFNIDVFKYVPFTIGLDYLNYDELNLYLESFKKIFDNINNYIFENDSINNQLYDRRKIPYRELFKLSDVKMGLKFYCEVPKTHYAGKNLWIVKAPNLNRGRCIKIFDNYNEIIKFLNEMKKGNVNQYDNIKENGYIYESNIKDSLNNNDEIKEEKYEEEKKDIDINDKNNEKDEKINTDNIKENKKALEDKEVDNNDITKEKNGNNINEYEEKEDKQKGKEKVNKENDFNYKENKEINNNEIINKDIDKENKGFNVKEDNIKENKEKDNKEDDVKDNKEKEKSLEKKEKGDYQSDIIIIQKYIERPFLYNGRKCDIRIWVLISHKMNVYIFKEGHLKASSVNYNVDNYNSFIHLTNYSLQKYNKNFSKYETGNEISFDTFQQYLDTLGDKSFNFRELIIPKFKKIIELTAKSSRNLINRKKKNYCFELFGYDFMMDEDKNVFLIEINTNPGLEISSEIISILVPRMIEDTLRITVDDLFETEYDQEWLDEEGNYKSKYHVDGYDDKENMWEFICNINKSNEKYINEDYYGFGYKSVSRKKHKKTKE